MPSRSQTKAGKESLTSQDHCRRRSREAGETHYLKRRSQSLSINGIGAPNSALGAFFIRLPGPELVRLPLGRAQGRVGRSNMVAFISLMPLFFWASTFLTSSPTIV